jgi:hypothetical protein
MGVTGPLNTGEITLLLSIRNNERLTILEEIQ